MLPDKKQTELPLRAAGGGESTEKAETIRVERLKPDGPTQKHLHKAFERHSEGQTLQEVRQFQDEAAFIEYMRTRAASALAPPPNVDLSQPMSSYYISSSHNTYLTGHQLYGDATTAGYTNVLKRGCRCLEIDIWDGDDSDSSDSSSDEELTRTGSSPKKSRWSRMKAKARDVRGTSPGRARSTSGHRHASPRNSESKASTTHVGGNGHLAAPPTEQPFKPEPQVVHGWTLTNAIPFRDVCAAIAESAFIATDLPLIVSLETHAKLAQQETMVEIMKEAWGQYLVDASAALDGVITLPSPDSLRKKILIKVKQGHYIPSSNTSASVLSQTSMSSAEGTQPKKPSKMLPALSELGTFTRAFSFKRWDQAEATLPTHVFSLTDSKAHDMHADPAHGIAMFNHNKTYLTRIYPKGTRISSSNYDPAFYWRHGAQIVALNWQKLDTGMMLNEAMFAGYEGWVLKPDGYRPCKGQFERPKPLASSADIASSIPKRTMVLKLQVFAGENLPFSTERDAGKVKPYIKLELHVDTHGPPGQGKKGEGQNPDQDVDEEDLKERRKHKRRSKTQKTDSPDFQGEVFSWTNIDVVEQLSFLRYVPAPSP